MIDDHSGRNLAQWAGENWRAVEESGKKAVMARKKNKITVISAAETKKLKGVADAVYARWFQEARKANLDGPAMLKDAKAMIAKHAK